MPGIAVLIGPVTGAMKLPFLSCSLCYYNGCLMAAGAVHRMQ